MYYMLIAGHTILTYLPVEPESQNECCRQFVRVAGRVLATLLATQRSAPHATTPPALRRGGFSGKGFPGMFLTTTTIMRKTLTDLGLTIQRRVSLHYRHPCLLFLIQDVLPGSTRHLLSHVFLCSAARPLRVVVLIDG